MWSLTGLSADRQTEQGEGFKGAARTPVNKPMGRCGVFLPTGVVPCKHTEVRPAIQRLRVPSSATLLLKVCISTSNLPQKVEQLCCACARARLCASRHQLLFIVFHHGRRRRTFLELRLQTVSNFLAPVTSMCADVQLLRGKQRRIQTAAAAAAAAV